MPDQPANFQLGYDFPGLDAKTFQIQNHNRLLGSYEGAVGIKTGFTTLSPLASLAPGSPAWS